MTMMQEGSSPPPAERKLSPITVSHIRALPSSAADVIHQLWGLSIESPPFACKTPTTFAPPRCFRAPNTLHNVFQLELRPHANEWSGDQSHVDFISCAHITSIRSEGEELIISGSGIYCYRRILGKKKIIFK